MLTIERVKIIKLSKEEADRIEKALARIIISAARRRWEKRESTSHLNFKRFALNEKSLTYDLASKERKD
jgi:hypothetical protein